MRFAFGIALGPALAGLLTNRVDWRAPFLLTSIGCIMAFLIGTVAMPKRHSAVARHETDGFRWLRNANVTRQLLAREDRRALAYPPFRERGMS